MGDKCQICGKDLEDFSLTHCSDECRFEAYLKSKSVCILLDIEDDLK
ncbi:MAG TPA: hypothetical protein VMW74_10885 [Nitrosopumilaceae archaeon]|nr:hypothetical protein [Nitrosopumilaceae archaeon]